MQHPYAQLEPTIAAQINHATVLPASQARATAIARNLLEHRSEYEAVHGATRVPLLFTAPVHERESDADFTTYLGNGDRLSRPTVHVPRGRGPFSTWYAGAIDALVLDRVNQVPDWTWERLVYEWLLYNGFGPLDRGRQSGYPWAGTNIYDGGKYVRDGVWDPDAWDTQLGCFAVARALVSLDSSLDLPRSSIELPVASYQPGDVILVPNGVGGSVDTTTLQGDLNRLGAFPPLVADGSYGRKTRAAVAAFQERSGIAVDGLAGPETIAALNDHLAHIAPAAP